MKYSQKLLTFVLGGLLVTLLPKSALTQGNSYPVGSRAIFLAGCLTDKSDLNLQDGDEVYSQMRICVCLLDKFQVAYTNTEFITLFDEANGNDSDAQQELNSFVKKYYTHCL